MGYLLTILNRKLSEVSGRMIGLLVVLAVVTVIALVWFAAAGSQDKATALDAAANVNARARVIARLATSDGSSAVRTLATVASDSDNPRLAADALRGLARMKANRPLRERTITQAYSSEHAKVRRAAVVATRTLCKPLYVEEAEKDRIVERLKEDPDATVRCAAARTLGRLRVHHAIPALLDLVETPDPDPKVRKAVGEAIQNITGYADFHYGTLTREESKAIADALRGHYETLNAWDPKWYLRYRKMLEERKAEKAGDKK